MRKGKPPGDSMAEIGPSGSGKSALHQPGLHRPGSGGVFFDGRDLARLDPVRVRRLFGSVLQTEDLIQGDLRLNILGPDRAADESRAWEAARPAEDQLG